VSDETDDGAEADGDENAVLVVIGAGARFEGLLSFWGHARIDGALRGEIAADGILEIGPDARIAAQIEVDVLVVEGLVEGEVAARERVEIRAGGRITAAVRTPRLVLAEGGSLEGRLAMTAGAAPSVGASATAASVA
jgi:cytoskeletal protein CcmA (bactofilin family)